MKNQTEKEAHILNRVILMGRLTRDPEIRYSQNDQSMAIARYTLAVDRRGRRDSNDSQQSADFINCTAFRQQAEFVEKYLRKGMKIAVVGRIQTGSYTNREGQRVYTTDVIVDEHEFCESKGASENGAAVNPQHNRNNGYQNNNSGDGFMNIPDGLDEELPFN